jgi:outer membrane protein OmpA-like peptidoglycan-associated protein
LDFPRLDAFAMSETEHNKPEGHAKPHKHGGGHGHGGGGGHEEAHEGAPEWLISFADNVALMMGFFVILLAMNMAKASVGGGGSKGDTGTTTVQTADMIDFAIAMREAFNNPVNMHSTNPADQALIRRILQRAGKSETRDPGVKGYEQDVQSIRPNDYYAYSGVIPFAENSSEIPEGSRHVITEMAQKVRGLRVIVEVRGHVSAVESDHGPETAMRLASERALAVAQALSSAGVDWWQMRLVVCGDNDRLAKFPNTRDADQSNARVEIVLTDEVVPDKVPSKSAQ